MTASDRVPIESVAATRVFDAFRNYNQRFREITRRAARHFETGDRSTGRLDAVRRIELYNKSVAAVTGLVDVCKGMMKSAASDKKSSTKKTTSKAAAKK